MQIMWITWFLPSVTKLRSVSTMYTWPSLGNSCKGIGMVKCFRQHFSSIGAQGWEYCGIITKFRSTAQNSKCEHTHPYPLMGIVCFVQNCPTLLPLFAVLVFHFCYNKLPQTYCLKTTQTCYLTFLKVRNLKCMLLS